MRFLILILVYLDVFAISNTLIYKQEVIDFMGNLISYEDAKNSLAGYIGPRMSYRTPEEAEKLGGHDLYYWQDIKNYTPEQRAKALEYVKGIMALQRSTFDERNQAGLELDNNMRPEAPMFWISRDNGWYMPGIKRKDPEGGILTDNGDWNLTTTHPIKYIADNPALQKQVLRNDYHKLYKKNGIYNTLIRKTRNGEELTPEEEDKLIEGYVKTQLNSQTTDTSNASLWNVVKGVADQIGAIIAKPIIGRKYKINPDNYKMKTYRPTLDELLEQSGLNSAISLGEQLKNNDDDTRYFDFYNKERTTKITPDTTQHIGMLGKHAITYGEDIKNNPYSFKNITQPSMAHLIYSNSPLTESDEEDLHFPSLDILLGRKVNGWKGVTHPYMTEEEVRAQFPHKPEYHGLPNGELDNPNSWYRGRPLERDFSEVGKSPLIGTSTLRTSEDNSQMHTWAKHFKETENSKKHKTIYPTSAEMSERGLSPISLDFVMKTAQGITQGGGANYGIAQDMVTTARKIIDAEDKDTQLTLLEHLDDLVYGMSSNNKTTQEKIAPIILEKRASDLEDLDVSSPRVSSSIYGKGPARDDMTFSPFMRTNPHGPGYMFKSEWKKHKVVPGSPEDLWNKAVPRADKALARSKEYEKNFMNALNDIEYLEMKDFPIWSKQSQALREKRKQEYLKKRELERQKSK